MLEKEKGIVVERNFSASAYWTVICKKKVDLGLFAESAYWAVYTVIKFCLNFQMLFLMTIPS